MNVRTAGHREARRARALAVAAAVTLLVPGCSVVHVHFGSSPPAPTYRELLAYAQCVRTHGLPDFPVPSPPGGPGSAVHVNSRPSGPVATRANDACKHLLDGASP